MKKVHLLVLFLLFATSTFGQWAPGYFKNYFGANTNDKYIEYISKNASLTKEVKSRPKTSKLQVRTKIYRLQNDVPSLYGMCFDLIVKDGTKPINSNTVLESECLLSVRLNDGQLFTYPVIATDRDLRVSYTDKINLVSILQNQTKTLHCSIKITSKLGTTCYDFNLNPMGLNLALDKHFSLETPAEVTPVKATPVVIAYSEEDSHIKDLGTDKIIIKDRPVYGVEHMPQFPGGDDELLNFIKQNLHYPPDAVPGRVTIRFVVNRNGTISDITVIRGLSPSCDKAALRVVKKFPKFTPGRQNGRTCRVYYTLPIVFKLQK